MTRAEVEQLIAEKVAPVYGLIDRFEGLMVRVKDIMDSVAVQQNEEELKKLRSVVERLMEAVATRNAEAEDTKRLNLELHQLTADMREKLGMGSS